MALFLDKERYFNATERDVHVWCSNLSGSESGSKLGLVAGCYTFNRLKVSIFYEWLKVIVDQQLLPYSFDELFLFRCKDPTLLEVPEGPHPVDIIPLPRSSDEFLTAGHYTIMRVPPQYANEPESVFVPIISRLVSARRFATRTQTATGSVLSPSQGPLKRSVETRRVVRKRDKKCVITGYAARRRDRGYNFTGLEVAHIFALADLKSDTITDNLEQESTDFLLAKAQADTPMNAILLRADIHAMFDNYQFGVWEDGQVYRFEQNGAPPLSEPSVNLDLSGLTNMLSPNAVKRILFREHFKIALSWHVAGLGMEKKGGGIFELDP